LSHVAKFGDPWTFRGPKDGLEYFRVNVDGQKKLVLDRKQFIGRIFMFKMPRGPSEIKWTSVKHESFLIARSLLTDENFFVLPVMLEDLEEPNAMEVIAWAAS